MVKASRKYDATRDGTLDGQWHFEFKDWKDAFEMFFRKKRMNRDYCLVISTASYTSGYWVERSATANKDTHVYRSEKEVRLLERRVRYAVKNQKSHALGAVVL